MGPPPTSRHVWQPGYWRRHGDHYAWVDGLWLVPPFAGWIWIAPTWTVGIDGGWYFIDGRWSPDDEDTIVIDTAPPPPLDETPPLAPSVDSFWVSGYWMLQENRWIWLPGRWEQPRPGFVWESPRWILDGSRWRFVPGGWRAVPLQPND